MLIHYRILKTILWLIWPDQSLNSWGSNTFVKLSPSCPENPSSSTNTLVWSLIKHHLHFHFHHILYSIYHITQHQPFHACSSSGLWMTMRKYSLSGAIIISYFLQAILKKVRSFEGSKSLTRYLACLANPESLTP